MPLSEYEQRVIDDLERSLLRDDPKLAHAFQTPKPHAYLRVVGVTLGVLFGVAMMVLGSNTHRFVLAALGLGVIVVSAAIALIKTHEAPTTTTEVQYNLLNAVPKELATSNSSEANSRFMGRLEDRWNRRQEAN